MSIEKIQEYLVSIGFDVDKKSFGEAKGVLAEFEKGAQKVGNAITSSFNMAGLAVADLGIAFTATAGVVKLFDVTLESAGKKLGNITMGVDKFALSLYTTRANARSLMSVMNAMGIDSIDDLKYTNLLPEQRQQFMNLRALSAQLAPDDETKQGLAELQSLGFEFQKFHMEMSYIGLKLLGSIGNILSSRLFQAVPIMIQIIIDVIAFLAKSFEDITKNHPVAGLTGGAISGLGGAMGGRVLGAEIGGALGAPLGPLGVAGGALLGGGIGGGLGGILGAGAGVALGGAAADHKKEIIKVVKEARNNADSAWKYALKLNFAYEGGYTGYNSKTGDPETNKGITSGTYADYKKTHPGAPPLKGITTEIATSIYKKNYWDQFNKYNLSDAEHVAAFNAAVNMGVGTSAKFVKGAHGDLHKFFDLQHQEYDAIARKNPNKRTYLKGWHNRTNDLEHRLEKQYPQQPMNVTINVNGATSPHATAAAVSHKLQAMMNTRNLQSLA